MDRQTDRLAKEQKERLTDFTAVLVYKSLQIHINRQTKNRKKVTDRQKKKQKDKDIDIHTDREIDIVIDRQTDRQTVRQTDRQTGR